MYFEDWSNQSYPKHTNIDEKTRSNKRRHVIAPVLCLGIALAPIGNEATQERQSTANVLVNDLNLSSQSSSINVMYHEMPLECHNTKE